MGYKFYKVLFRAKWKQRTDETCSNGLTWAVAQKITFTINPTWRYTASRWHFMKWHTEMPVLDQVLSIITE